MRLWLFLIFVLAGVTGCGHAGMPSSVPDMASSETSRSLASLKTQVQTVGGGTTDAAAPALPAVHGRMIVRSAQMQIIAADPVATLRTISSQIESQGGYISDSKQWLENGQPHATVTLRVPAPLLTSTLAEIRKSALRTESENISGQDVSQEYTDLSAQLINLEATEKELRELLTTVRQRTQRASDVLDVFNQLTKIRGEIDQTKGQLLDMGQLVDLATISLDIAPDSIAPLVAQDVWHPGGVVSDAFHALVTTLKWLCDILIWVCLYIVPLAALIGIPAFFIRRSYRAARQGRNSTDNGNPTA